MKKDGFIIFAILILFSFYSTNLFAWGHLADIKLDESLMYSILKNKEIKYCVNIEEEVRDSFSHNGMVTQVRTAIKVWYESLASYDEILNLSPSIKITNIPCDNNESIIYLRVNARVAKPSDRFSAHYADKHIIPSNKRTPQIEFIQNFENHKHIDLSKNFLKEEDLVNNLEKACTHKMTLGDFLFEFQEKLNQDKSDKTTSSETLYYPTLLHELGHAWGLCDQYPGREENCDPNYTNGKISSSLMNRDRRFYPTKDDLDGLVQMIKRYYKAYPELNNNPIVKREKKSRLEGEYKTFYDNGSIKTISNYKNGDLISRSAYYPDGKLSRDKFFFGESLIYRTYDENGREASCGESKNSIIVEDFFYYPINGNIEYASTYKNNGDLAKVEHFHESGFKIYVTNTNVNINPSGFILDNYFVEHIKYYENGNKKEYALFDPRTKYYSAKIEYDIDGKEVKRIEKNNSGYNYIHKEFDNSGNLLKEPKDGDATFYVSSDGKVSKIITTSDYSHGDIFLYSNGHTKHSVFWLPDNKLMRTEFTYFESNGRPQSEIIYNSHGLKQKETWYSETCEISELSKTKFNKCCPVEKLSSYRYYENGNIKTIYTIDKNLDPDKYQSTTYYKTGELYQSSTFLISIQKEILSVIYNKDGSICWEAKFDPEGNLLSTPPDECKNKDK